MKKIYFPNLNGLRFIAAYLVVIHHLERLKQIMGIENYAHVPFVEIIGRLGVILFFVLSGFLITYLLLEEENQTGTISVKNFYIRRILRIWPLYYLIIGLSLFVLPNISFFDMGDLSATVSDYLGQKTLLFLLFLPNLAMIIYARVPYASQAWSVGVEEQFYLIWPVLMKYVKNKTGLLFSVIIVYLILKVVFRGMIHLGYSNYYLETLKALWSSFSIDCMAIGGLFAYAMFKQHKILTLLYNKYLQWMNLFALVLMLGFGVFIPLIHVEFYGVLFGILILNLSVNPKTIISLENPVFNYLGKISYGLYMYHVLCIMIVLKALLWMGTENIILQYTFSTGLTIVISGISYAWYEKYFIKKKVKFSKIVSGDNAEKGQV